MTSAPRESAVRAGSPVRTVGPWAGAMRASRWLPRLLGVLGVLGVLVVALLGAAVWIALDSLPDRADGAAPQRIVDPPPADAQVLARGLALARLGNCAGCHTAPGAAPYAGGRALATPFGTVYAGNLTPDDATGLGRWSSDEFWRAMHHGRGRDGRLLTPAFPYTSFTHLSRDDTDALWRWLRSLPPVVAQRPPHALRWPFGSRPALAVWRALFFRADAQPVAPPAGATAARGAWLVRGPGHCAECHAARNALGGRIDPDALLGGLLPMADWEAPALACLGGRGTPDAARAANLVALLRDGRSGPDSVAGPMAEVVLGSTQWWSEDDLRAVAAHLATLPCPPGPPPPEPLPAERRALGQRLYSRHCADCHGAQGEGVPGVYPALAGNRSVNLPTATNLVQAMRHGGFAPATVANPRPYSMPPQFLNDDEIAALASWVRQAWGNRAQPVGWLEVSRMAR